MAERAMITDPDVFFARGCGRCDRFDTPDCVTRKWESGLRELRQICRDVGLEETAKWGHPCYMHAGRNIALIGALRDDFRLNFFKATLLADREGILVRQGPNTQTPDSVKFTANDQPEKLQDTLRAYLEEAKDYAEQGVVPERKQAEFELPEELIEALDADPDYAEGFHGLTPGRQRSYVLHVGGAKRAETRVSRVEKMRAKVLSGKGFNEY